jgi:hypothetical protein
MYFNIFYRPYEEQIVDLEVVYILLYSLLLTQQVPNQASFLDI